MSKLRKLEPDELTVHCSDNDFCLQRTGNLPPLYHTVGRQKALPAAREL